MVDTERCVTLFAKVAGVPNYLVVKRKVGNFAKVSPFLVKKAMTVCVGLVVQDIRKPRVDFSLRP